MACPSTNVCPADQLLMPRSGRRGGVRGAGICTEPNPGQAAAAKNLGHVERRPRRDGRDRVHHSDNRVVNPHPWEHTVIRSLHR